MTLFEAISLLVMVSTIECQIMFPTRNPGPTDKASGSNGLNECWIKDGRAGTCYEFRSNQFKQCSFYPSIDTTDANVAKHLRANVCKNNGREVFFCCPNNTPVQPVTELPTPPGNVVTTVTSCDGTSEGCVRPTAIPFENECGKTSSDNVVGGEESVRGAWPWLAALGQVIDGKFSPFCGGTLISKQHVITAAHCFNIQRNNIIVRLGEYNTDEAQDGAQDFSIVGMRVGDYKQDTKENDIILLKLDRPLISYTVNIQAACLPYHLRHQTFEGNTPIVVGWGIFDNDNRGASPIPLQARVPVVPIPECREKYRFSGNTINNNQICAGRGMKDSCGGDSGGPLNYIDVQRFRFYVIGLVSFGPRNCGSQNTPGVYLRVGAYLDWIDENVKALS